MTIATYPPEITDITQPLPVFESNNGSGEQAKLTDLTRYVRTGGVDVDKLRDSEIDGVFIQIGVGLTENEILDEQIGNALDAGKSIAFFHLPSAYTGPVKEQARQAVQAVKDRGFDNPIIEADYEPAIAGDYDSLITADKGWIYHQELEFRTGREQPGYSNPNVLKYKWALPTWIYQRKWIIARYKLTYSSSTGWRQYWYYHEYFTDYPWTVPDGILPDIFYQDCVIGCQFTEKLRAQYYFASKYTDDPKHKVGIKSGTGYALLMTPAQMAQWFGDAVPEPELTLEEKVERLWTAHPELW